MGAAASRNPLLLRNTFNIEIYNEFLKQKRDMRSDFKKEYKLREEEVMKFIDKETNDMQDQNWIFRSKINKIKELTGSNIKRSHIVKILAEDIGAAAAKVDISFFKTMELGLETEHQAQVDAAL